MKARGPRVVTAAILLSACADAGPVNDGTSARDSAGITIIESAAPAWPVGGGWRLTDTPTLTIGEEEGDTAYLFARAVGALRLADGRIVVADGGSNQLRFYDAGGRFLHAAGRAGEGPGEFEYIRALKRCDASEIYAFDLNWQTAVYSSHGNFIREWNMLDPSSGRTPYALACSGDGRFVITGWGQALTAPTIGFHRTTSPISVMDTSGALLFDLGEYPSSERIGTERGSRPHPFGRSTSVEIGREAVYVGTAEALEVRKFPLTGQRLDPDRRAAAPTVRFRIIRGPAADLQITPEHLDRYRAAQVERVSAERRPALERELRDMPVPPGFPAYTELKLDAEGNLWIRRFMRPGEDVQYWTVFDSDGMLLGDVLVPRALNVTDIGGDYVLGIHQDELGVERVQVYGLLKERQRP